MDSCCWAALPWVRLVFYLLTQAMTSYTPSRLAYFLICLTFVLGWHILYAPYPLLPLTHHGRNGDVHSHPAAALAVTYMHPKVVESLQFLLLHLHDQLLIWKRRCCVAVSFLTFYWTHHGLANSWSYGYGYIREDPPVAVTSHLQDLAQGKLVVRLVRLHDFPESRPQGHLQSCPTWFDSLYLAFPDWRRVAIATMTCGELEYANKLLIDASTCDFPSVIEYDVSSEKGQSPSLRERGRYLHISSDPWKYVGPYGGRPFSAAW
jgi:hypothetical protein